MTAVTAASRPASLIARVAVPVPLPGLFDYQLLPEHIERAQPGCRVEVLFGRRRLTAVIMQIRDHSELAEHRLKTVSRLLDSEPCLDPLLLKLLQWCATYYHHAPGEVVSAALTSRLRQGKACAATAPLSWRCVDSQQDTSSLLSRAPRQRQLYQLLLEAGSMDVGQLDAAMPQWRASMKALLARGLVENCENQPAVAASGDHTAPQPGAQQQAVLDAMGEQFDSHQVHLLHGVTGSGKTEIYIRLAQACIAQHRQVLVIVPEISLTPQLTRRFEQRLAARIAVLHSGLNDSERHNAWIAAAAGETALIIGTRSAVFTPMPQLGLIIIDEEHDNSLKQQEGFRYHGRDVALVRARDAGIPVLMGSATPSLESLHNAHQQRYQYHRLSERIVSQQAVDTELIDMRRQPVSDGLSAQLATDIDRHLAAGNQVMLFLNRRGYAPVLLCHQCGWTVKCERCAAHMTYHQASQRLRCHHCDRETPVPQHCGDCGSEELMALGAGTERIEQALANRFEGVSLCRIDRDTTRARGELEARLESIRRGDSRLIIGTQMLAKGHDFPDVTLVGILDTDQALYSADFRAPEHLAQLIIQVAGRAGRAHKPGEVRIQTHHPDHPLLQRLLHQGYEAFSQLALEEREQAGLPPSSHLVLLRCEALQLDTAFGFMQPAVEILRQQAGHEVSIFGPMTAPMEKRAGRYRTQLMLQSTQRRSLHLCLRHSLPRLQALPQARQVRWNIDVDPVDTY